MITSVAQWKWDMIAQYEYINKEQSTILQMFVATWLLHIII